MIKRPLPILVRYISLNGIFLLALRINFKLIYLNTSRNYKLNCKSTNKMIYKQRTTQGYYSRLKTVLVNITDLLHQMFHFILLLNCRSSLCYKRKQKSPRVDNIIGYGFVTALSSENTVFCGVSKSQLCCIIVRNADGLRFVSRLIRHNSSRKWFLTLKKIVHFRWCL